MPNDTREISLTALTDRQKEYLLSFDIGVLSRVARSVGRSRPAVHKVFRGLTKNSPVIYAALEKELNETCQRIVREDPSGAALFLPRRRGSKSK